MEKEAVLVQEAGFVEGKASSTVSQKIAAGKEDVKSAKRSERLAYEEIVKKHMRSAYFIALGFVHNHQDALDLSQEAFVRAFRKWDSYNKEKPFFPWFYKLMKNLCLDHLKRRRRISEVPIESMQTVEGKREDREMQDVLWHAINDLPFEQKEIVILRYFRQLSYREIAELVGKPEGTVMSSLYYARKKLKDRVAYSLGLEEKG